MLQERNSQAIVLINILIMIRALYKAISALEVQKEKERRLKKKRSPERAGNPWSDAEDNQLVSNFETGLEIRNIARKHKRTVGAIESQLVRLGKIESKRIQA